MPTKPQSLGDKDRVTLVMKHYISVFTSSVLQELQLLLNSFRFFSENHHGMS